MPLVIADYSEWQGVVHPPAGQVVIIRAHNGLRADRDFAHNRALAHDAGCPAIGLYQYLVAGQDAAYQARLLILAIGSLAPNEWLICDIEEGQGDEQPRWQAWEQVVLSSTGRPGWLYSGLSFVAAHDLQAPDWVAAYGQGEPTVPHKLWQYTDRYPWPWGPGDASVYDGTLPQFLAQLGMPVDPADVVSAQPKPAPPVPAKEDPPMVLANDGTTQFIVSSGPSGLIKQAISSLSDPDHPELQQIAAAVPNLGTVPAFLGPIPTGAAI